MKRTALKPSSKRMARGGLPKPTKADVALFGKLSSIGCVVCYHFCRHPDGSRAEGSVTQIHHILSGTVRISHRHVIPLCKMHHDEGRPGQPSFHSINGKYGKAEFENTFATEMELVMLCEEWINEPYVTGLKAIDVMPDDVPLCLEWASENSLEITGLLTDEQAPQNDTPPVDNYRDTDSDANVESNTSDDANAAQTLQRFSTQVRVLVTHRRIRLADPHGPSDKWAMDAIVRAKILKDDSAKEIAGIDERQEKIKPGEKESTLFTFTEVI